MTAGAYPIAGVGKLPNVSIAYPGEVWSNVRANGIIIPGACVAPVNVGGKLSLKQVLAGDSPDIDQVGVAMRQVEIPDTNGGPGALGPNEIVNQAIADGDWLRRYMSGALHLTLCTPLDTYVPGEKIGWNPAGARPSGKAAGTGAWSNTGIKAGTAIFELMEVREYGSGDDKLLTVKYLRANQ